MSYFALKMRPCVNGIRAFAYNTAHQRVLGGIFHGKHHNFSTSAARLIMETTGFTETQMTVREAVGQLCSQFPNTYWQQHDQTETDPKEFRRYHLFCFGNILCSDNWRKDAALAKDGWLGIALPESLGGTYSLYNCVCWPNLSDDNVCVEQDLASGYPKPQ